MVNCPRCDTENQDNAMNCKSCHINLAFAFSHPEEFGLEMTPQSLPNGGDRMEFICRVKVQITRNT